MDAMFRSEDDGFAGVGALLGCALAILMLLLGTGVMVSEFTSPSFSDAAMAQVKAECDPAHC